MEAREHADRDTRKGARREGAPGKRERRREPARGRAAQPPWHKLSKEEVLSKLDARPEGLSDEEARQRLGDHGPNEVGQKEEVSRWRVLVRQFESPLIYVLLVALAVTLAIQSWADAIAIGAVLVINATVGFVQEYRAESAVQALIAMVSPKAKVRRSGQERRIDSAELVPGDVVRLEEGGMVPADVRLLGRASLQINEAALTGESVPAAKHGGAMDGAEDDLPPADQENMAFMGTAVTSGSAEGVVVATGRETEIGDIAAQVGQAERGRTPLQRRMDRLAKALAVIILVVAGVTFGVGLLLGRTVQEMFLLAVALAVAAMPEGLPVVTTVALAVGVRRMADRHAIIRHLPAVETLGSTTAIVADKTGTLTQNRMTVGRVFAGGETYELTGGPLQQGELRRAGEAVAVEPESAIGYTLLAGALNNSAEVHADGEGEADLAASGDPMDVAMLVAARKATFDASIAERYPKIDEVPFETERRFSATVHERNGRAPLVLVKGAPERVAKMCDRFLRADGEVEDLDRDAVSRTMDDLASQGLRVLAMAIGEGEDARRAVKSDEPRGLTFVGMQGIADPPRPEAAHAVDDCHGAGIRVLMVGDHARTAAAIAEQVHVGRPVQVGAPPEEREDSEAPARGELPEVVSGQQLGRASDEELDRILDRAFVFARVKPQQKLRLVRRLEDRGEIVAVTGDGVNDAPALKEATLGAAMGSGTDVAKEASDMVITDDDFASVYAAVEQGRTAFRNIRMATFFLLSTGAAIVLVILSALLMGLPVLLLPSQILWCNVVTNGIQDVALGFEPGEKALFRRPPRPAGEGVLSRLLIERTAVIGVWLAAGTLGTFTWKHLGGASLTQARTAALTTLVLFQMVHVFNCRSEEDSVFHKSLWKNKVLLVGVVVSLAVHVAALYLPFMQALLRVEPLDALTWGVMAGVAATAILVNELHKRLRARRPAEGRHAESQPEGTEPGRAEATA